MKFSSTEDGGGVPGRATGIVPDTMTVAGDITKATRLFTDIFTKDGEMISGIIDGEVNHGNIIGYIMKISIVTGATGKEQDTGTDLLPRGHIVIAYTDRGQVIRHLPLCADTVIGLIPECTMENPVRTSPAKTVTGAGPAMAAMVDPADNPVFIIREMKGLKRKTG